MKCKKIFKMCLMFMLVCILFASMYVSSSAATAQKENYYAFTWWSNSGGILVPLSATGYSQLLEDYSVLPGSILALTHHRVYASIKSYIPGGTVIITMDSNMTYSNGQSTSISNYPVFTNDTFYVNKEGSSTIYANYGTTVSAHMAYCYYTSSGSLATPIYNQYPSLTL